MTRLEFLKLSLLSLLGLFVGANGRAAEQRGPEHYILTAEPARYTPIYFHTWYDGSSGSAAGWYKTTISFRKDD